MYDGQWGCLSVALLVVQPTLLALIITQVPVALDAKCHETYSWERNSSGVLFGHANRTFADDPAAAAGGVGCSFFAGVIPLASSIGYMGAPFALTLFVWNRAYDERYAVKKGALLAVVAFFTAEHVIRGAANTAAAFASIEPTPGYDSSNCTLTDYGAWQFDRALECPNGAEQCQFVDSLLPTGAQPFPADAVTELALSVFVPGTVSFVLMLVLTAHHIGGPIEYDGKATDHMCLALGWVVYVFSQAWWPVYAMLRVGPATKMASWCSGREFEDWGVQTLLA